MNLVEDIVILEEKSLTKEVEDQENKNHYS
jgi:hypothetical protein